MTGKVRLWGSNFTQAARKFSAFMAFISGAALMGCSIHPVPDDVSPLSTELIVANARCELRLGIAEKFQKWFDDQGILGIDANYLGDKGVLDQITRRYGAKAAAGYAEYINIAVAYDFTFDVSEHDDASGSAGFSLPMGANTFSMSTGANLNTTRAGKRTFQSQEKLSQLLTKDWYTYCHDKVDPEIGPLPRDPNHLYPITGTIGLRKVAHTFLNIAYLGGGQDSFVDTLTFTTSIGGHVTPAVTFTPVPNNFRLINASATLEAGRQDVHTLKISLAFPKSAQLKEAGMNVRERAPEMGASAPRQSPRPVVAVSGGRSDPAWRARYNLCVQDGHERENALQTLRYTAPEVYCLEYADAFGPQLFDAVTKKP
jgi:hypothetical protein